MMKQPKRNVFSLPYLCARKIALPVRFAEVKGEAAKPSCRKKQNSTPPEDT
jgi:hypothetical protein